MGSPSYIIEKKFGEGQKGDDITPFDGTRYYFKTYGIHREIENLDPEKDGKSNCKKHLSNRFFRSFDLSLHGWLPKFAKSTNTVPTGTT
jgi:hypothetical protein